MERSTKDPCLGTSMPLRITQFDKKNLRMEMALVIALGAFHCFGSPIPLQTTINHMQINIGSESNPIHDSIEMNAVRVTSSDLDLYKQ